MSETAGNLMRLLDERGAELHGLLFRLTMREDVAEDLLQDLFLRLSTSEGFADARNAYAYARTAAIRLAFDWRRSRRVRPAESVADEPVGPSRSPLADAIESEQIDRVLAAMQQLADAQREIIAMRYLQQMSYEDIAGQLDVTAHQARARCAKAMRRLRAMLNVRPKAKKIEETPRVES